jgi:glycerol-3-phosphate dehydrogenase (NAD(P)+)
VKRVAVMGAGSWGTVLAGMLADNGREVTLWARRPELAETIAVRHRNPDYLPGVRLPASVSATADAAAALAGADVVALALPAQVMRHTLRAWRSLIPDGAAVVSLAKGVEHASGLRMSEVIHGVLGVPMEFVAALSGPNLAQELAMREPSAAVVAGVDDALVADLAELLATPYFRIYTSRDLVGVELGGAVKNVIALACGMAEGLGYGVNTRASIMTRGLAETTRLGVALGAEPETFAGLAGLGDLAATCMSPLSRNRAMGQRIGSGEPVSAVLGAGGQVAEGVLTCEPIGELARRHAVAMPITEAVADVVHAKASVHATVERLLAMPPGPERPGLSVSGAGGRAVPT